MEKERIYVTSDKLKLILSDNKDNIGKSKYAGVDKIFAGIAFLIPIVITDFSRWHLVGLVSQIILVLVCGIGYTLYGFWESYKIHRYPFDKVYFMHKLRRQIL